MISVIILNWNGWTDTIECLKSLKSAEVPVRENGPETVRFFVVDNGSTDDSLAKFEKFRYDPSAPAFTLVETGQNLGFAGGMNVGIRRAIDDGASWILLLNNDTTVTPAFLRLLTAAGDRDPHIGMLNPKILRAAEPTKFWFIGGRVNWMHTRGSHASFGEEDRGQHDTPAPFETDYCTGCCLLARRELIEEIGLLPEAYFIYYEDTEWGIRARRRQWRCVVVPEAKIFHKGAASSREHSFLYIRYHIRNGLLLARRTGNPLQIGAAYSTSALRAFHQLIKRYREPKKRRWSSAILLGIKDAWLGRTGKIR